MTAPVRVVVADDQDLVRTGFELILRNEPSVVVVGEARDGFEAVELAATLVPDVILMDIRMPLLDGLEATRRVGALAHPPRVLVLTTFDDDEYVYEALRVGASGFLLKDAPAQRLVAAIEIVAAGGSLFAPSVTRRLIERFSREPIRRTAVSLPTLTARELEVLGLVATGLSNADIAAALSVTEHTVKTHVASLLSKLHLKNRVQAVVLAYESGLITPS